MTDFARVFNLEIWNCLGKEFGLYMSPFRKISLQVTDYNKTKDHIVKIKDQSGLRVEVCIPEGKKQSRSLKVQISEKYLPYIRLSSLYWRKLQLESALC
jgi:hypothetical protein